MTDTAFALYLHDSIVQRCQYSDGATEQTTAYDAWFGSVTDGFGYALLYALFCREAEIDCAVVRGTVTGGDETGEHAWNVLTLDGVTGCTDVMWNDSETQTEHRLPFHGYYFLSAAEIGADHTPTAGIVFPSDDNTENYYEMQELCITDAAQTDAFLAELLTDARSVGGDTVELWVDPALGITDYALEQALTRAIDTANAQALSAPQLRQVHRVYRSSVGGGGMTVLLFYEENDEQPGET